MKNRRFLVAAGLLAAVCLGSRSTVWAADTSIAVLGIEATDGAPDSVAAALTDALRQRASSERGYKLVPGKDLIEVKLIFSCPDEAPSCMAEAAKSLGATKLVFGGVKKAAGDSFVVTLKLLDTGRKQVDAWVAEQITRVQATPAAIRGPVQKWFATLTGQGAMGIVKVKGDVPGTAVSLDGSPVGTIGSDDLVLPAVPAGRHEILASKPGYAPVRKDVNVVAGSTAEVDISMSPESGAAAAASGAAGGDGSIDAVASAGTELPAAPDGSGGKMVARVAAWSALALSLGSFGMAAYYGNEVRKANRDLDPYRRFPCAPGVTNLGFGCTADGKAAKEALRDVDREYAEARQDQGKQFQNWQYVAIGVGAVFAITSGVFLYKGYLAEDTTMALGPKGRRKDSPRLQILPFAHASGGAVSARLTF